MLQPDSHITVKRSIHDTWVWNRPYIPTPLHTTGLLTDRAALSCFRPLASAGVAFFDSGPSDAGSPAAGSTAVLPADAGSPLEPPFPALAFGSYDIFGSWE